MNRTHYAEYSPASRRWSAFYRDLRGCWHVALDWRRMAIECETESLALSVARYRRRRLRIWK